MYRIYIYIVRERKKERERGAGREMNRQVSIDRKIMRSITTRYIHTHTHTHIYIYIYLSLSLYIYIYIISINWYRGIEIEWERNRGRVCVRDKESEREGNVWERDELTWIDRLIDMNKDIYKYKGIKRLNVKLVGFRSRFRASCVSSHTEEFW